MSITDPINCYLYSFLLFITFISQDFLLGLQVRYAAFYTEVCVECISDWNVAPQEVVRVWGSGV